MIITSDIAPEKNLYYIGAEVLKWITDKEEKSFDIIDLYNYLKDSIKVSFTYYTYALDWLFILKLIELGSEGGLQKCF